MENLAKTGNASITYENYIKTLKDQLNDSGIGTYTFSELNTKTISGNEYQYIEASISGITQYYYIRKEGKYMIGIIITVFGSDNIDNILENFEEIPKVSE
ncbi:MAG TPA: hypothetical protein DDZ99_10425 [Clostridiales bacterium]|nr:hypothetical protein [Clostridiales bacterium]